MVPADHHPATAGNAAADTLLTCDEVAAILRFHPETVRLMARRGRIAGAAKYGARWRFDPARLAVATDGSR